MREASRVHADAGQLRGLADVNAPHHTLKDKPWSYVQSQGEFAAQNKYAMLL